MTVIQFPQRPGIGGNGQSGGGAVGYVRPSHAEMLDGARAAYGLGFQYLGLVYPFDDQGACTCQKVDCTSPGKHPVGGPRQVYRSVEELWPQMVMHELAPGLFAPTGSVNGITVIDCDSGADGEDGAWVFEQWMTSLGVVLPAGLRQRTPNGEHVFLWYVEGLKAKTGLKGCVDIRNDGGLIVIAPSLHVSGRRYAFDARWPVVPVLDAVGVQALAEEKARKNGRGSGGSGGGAGGGAGRDDACNVLAWQCKKRGWSEGAALEEVRKLWAGFDQPPVASHAFTLEDAEAKVYNVYADATVVPDRSWSPELVAAVAGGERIEEVYALWDGQRPTDVGNANRLAAIADGRIRYVVGWGRWIVYDEGCWHIDGGNVRVTGWAKQVAREMFRVAAELDGHDREEMWKWAKRSESAAAISAMIRLCADIPGVLIDHRDLDQKPYLLNVLNGTIDLKTGALLEHDPEHLLTRQAPVMFDAGAECGLWERCLGEWQPNEEVRGYLQRVMGTACTGHPVEAIFINHGEGGNGKGKFFGAIQRVLGPYVAVPHKSLLVAQTHQQHETVMADLFGVRMAVAAETEAGERLDEASLKELTGGDVLAARRMREDRWQFKPSHTLFLHTNHRPRVRGSDEGVWRRVQLIRWDVTIEVKDEHLSGKLEGEASGILNWLVRGAREWLQGGLQVPGAVIDATAAYRGEEDHLGRYLGDCCVVGAGKWVASSALRASYEAWCLEVGENPWSQRALGGELTRRGFDRAQFGHAKVKGWRGLDLAVSAVQMWRP